MTLLDRDTLASAMLQSAADLLEASGEPALALDLDSVAALGEEKIEKVAQWCRQQPCPVMGVGPDDSAAIGCVDVVATSGSELQTMMRRVAANPEAATVLVQVLRTIESLSVQDALVVESLAYATLQSGQEFKRWLADFQSQNKATPLKEDGPAVVVERSDELLTLTLNRPENDNAYTVEMRDALVETFRLVALDDSIRQVKMVARGRCFSTGGELTEFGVVSSPVAGHLIRSQLLPAHYLIPIADRCHVHVHGACVGSGLELPAFAGHVTAAAKTLFWLPELSMGLIPGAGGCVSISRRIGRQRTAYLVLLNKKIDAKKALAWGLIDAIV